MHRLSTIGPSRLGSLRGSRLVRPSRSVYQASLGSRTQKVRRQALGAWSDYSRQEVVDLAKQRIRAAVYDRIGIQRKG